MPPINFDNRVKTLKQADPLKPGPVAYLMARDNRVQDNWALAYAQKLALEQNSPLIVLALVAADYPRISDRQRWFLIEGLKQVSRELDKLSIPFLPILETAIEKTAEVVATYSVTHLVTDFNPLIESRRWKQRLAKRVDCTIEEVDAHNIVPVWEASEKQEYAAYTIRPKINRQLRQYLTDIPEIIKHPHKFKNNLSPDDLVSPALSGTDGLLPALWKPGSKSGYAQAEIFFAELFNRYHLERNDPNADCQSDLSPWLHFGMISAQRIALIAHHFETDTAALEAFLEELIVRRELSDNFSYYNPAYDSLDGFPDWAKKSLEEHRHDPRPHAYSYSQLANGKTDDNLWNAAQKQLLLTGKMHGYLRMYWAKKILEWSSSPEQALDWTNGLNDSYSLDGCDPNGYVGTAWSIGGVHDRAWQEREIFGKVRYMNYNGCKRKFDIDEFTTRITELERQSTG